MVSASVESDGLFAPFVLVLHGGKSLLGGKRLGHCVEGDGRGQSSDIWRLKLAKTLQLPLLSTSDFFCLSRIGI